MKLAPALLAAALLAPSALLAQSTACLPVGIVGAVGCQNSPSPLLTGGVPATALLTYSYDATLAQLQLTVENTSPVLSGQTTPVITRIAFNVPAGVSSVMLVSQSGTGGVAPSYQLTYTGTQSLMNGCLGDFDVELSTMLSTGAIANANATSFPNANYVLGPATFTLQLAGTGTAALIADDFAMALSSGGIKDVGAALRFQGGGVGAQESGFVSSGEFCCPTSPAVQTVGAGCAPQGLTVPTLASIADPIPGANIGVDIASPSTPNSGAFLVFGSSTTFNSVFNLPLPVDLGQFGFAGCSLLVDSEFVVFLPLDASGDGSYGIALPALLKWCGRQLAFQSLMLSPSNELLTTAGLALTIGS